MDIIRAKEICDNLWLTDEQHEAINILSAEIERLQADNKRLREALGKIIDNIYLSRQPLTEMENRIIEIAREFYD